MTDKGGLCATFCEKIDDPLNRECCTTRGSIIFPPKVATRPPSAIWFLGGSLAFALACPPTPDKALAVSGTTAGPWKTWPGDRKTGRRGAGGGGRGFTGKKRSTNPPNRKVRLFHMFPCGRKMHKFDNSTRLLDVQSLEDLSTYPIGCTVSLGFDSPFSFLPWFFQSQLFSLLFPEVCYKRRIPGKNGNGTLVHFAWMLGL